MGFIHLKVLFAVDFKLLKLMSFVFTGDLVYAVNGPTSSLIPVQGFTIDPLAETVLDHWGPNHQVV